MFRRCGRPLGVSSRLQPLCGLRLRTALRFVCSPLQPFGPPMCASSLAALPASLGSSAAIAPSIRNGRPAAPYGLQYSRLSVQHGRSASFASSLAALPASLGSSTAIAPTIRNGRPAAPYGLQYSRLSVQHGRSASFASSLAVLPASLGSSAAIAATGCAASFALIGLTTACFAHCARPSCAPLAAPSLSPSLGLLRAASRTARALRAPLWSIPPSRLRRATSLYTREALG